MTLKKSNSVRFKDVQVKHYPPLTGEIETKQQCNMDGTEAFESGGKNTSGIQKIGSRSSQTMVATRVFAEEYEKVNKTILDPQGSIVIRWNMIFLVASTLSLFIDPLFFYLPKVRDGVCIDTEQNLQIVLTTIRSVADLFYAIQIVIRFRTAFVAPSSRIFGRGELVIDPSKIAARYLANRFWIDLIAALPLPQILLWAIIPNLNGWIVTDTNYILRLVVGIQYLPRIYLMFPLCYRIIKDTGVIAQRAWVAAFYNLVLYMLVGHVTGACWYLLSAERQELCWRKVCELEKPFCNYGFLDCRRMTSARDAWLGSSNITDLCNADSSFVQFGIYADAVTHEIMSRDFAHKLSYSFWWALVQINSLGQMLTTTTYLGEIFFGFVVGTVSLLCFASVIANVQRFILSTNIRREEWRLKRMDTEEWMHYRQLPHCLRECVRRFIDYKWAATQGVDEEAVLADLPWDLRIDIKRFLCLYLVRQVPLFDELDERTLDAICVRLRSAVWTRGTCLVREGDTLDEMTFIIRGYLDSYTTNGGRTGFFNSSRIGPKDFCGEELLTWALDPHPRVLLPLSTRTVRALTDVEGFTLGARDLRFVASQFRKLHSKELRHKFRFHSHQWRTWAACCIQTAWRRHKQAKQRRRELAELRAGESGEATRTYGQGFLAQATHMAVLQAARRQFKKKMVLARQRAEEGSSTHMVHEDTSEQVDDRTDTLKKPDEPDFSVDDDHTRGPLGNGR